MGRKTEIEKSEGFSATKPLFLLFPLSSSLFTLFILDASERQKSYEEVLPLSRFHGFCAPGKRRNSFRPFRLQLYSVEQWKNVPGGKAGLRVES
ncbi:hypothetical protein [uncultured Dialister sp.]|jgi:hypothetical protein|uniref:hypothetical protein n=1 Tax=uncultured Dialister sp. TaxID=278064 RepID=UPI0025D29A68|nr:hypothetical protein [uncultured Dialister sp.]